MKYRVMTMICAVVMVCGLVLAAGITYAKAADDSTETVLQENENAETVIPQNEEWNGPEEANMEETGMKDDGSRDDSLGDDGAEDDGREAFRKGDPYYPEAGIQVCFDAMRDGAAGLSAVGGSEDADGTENEGGVVTAGDMASDLMLADNFVPEPEEESEYADLAIADVKKYVNVRSQPTTESDIVGKIYDGAVAHILAVAGEENDWFQIVSGNVEGYIKAEFFIYGDAAVAVVDDYVTRYADVTADRLNVREQPDIEASRVGYIDRGERVKILEDLGDWLKVQYTDRSTGYVAAQYVTVSEEFVYAKTLEEEARELAEKKALEERKRVPEEQAAESTVINVAPPDTSYSTNEELRQQIVDYAMQYLGNKYVHGGQTLAGGTDCSGFTSLIYKEFGYSLSRTPEGQLSKAGRSVDYSQAQPGDIICYGSSGKCTHVALYIGNGEIIHAANSRKGVIIGKADYDTILGVKNVID